ncbi:MAG: glycosyltransferase, partial [bacterium]
KDCLVDRMVVGARENVDTFVHQMGRAERKFTVIPTGIDLQKFRPDRFPSPVREEFGYSPDVPVIGMISRLSEERKGASGFLEMAAQVATAFPKCAFLIVGDGKLRPQLEQQARRLGIAGRVTFTGWRTDAPEIHAGLDVFVMPSLFEGGPTTVLEAMASGKPVVATSVGMVPEVIADRHDGMIVPPGDSNALAVAVSELLANAGLRMDLGAQARVKAERSLSIDRMVERYLEVFAEVLTAAPR